MNRQGIKKKAKQVKKIYCEVRRLDRRGKEMRKWKAIEGILDEEGIERGSKKRC